MGLDMFVYKVPKNYKLSPTSISPRFSKKEWKELDSYEIQYWRKHHQLHNFFCEICNKKGGVPPGHCEIVELDKEDLIKTKEYIENNISYNDHIFFNDDNENYQEEINRLRNIDLSFVDKALKALEDGYCVFYFSSW